MCYQASTAKRTSTTKILRAQKGRTSVSHLTEEIQMQYGEYARKKKNALMKRVEKGLTIAMKELQKEGIIISTDGSSSSESEADYEADQHKDKNIMNSMINSMYRQGRPATPTSVNKVSTSGHTTSVSSSADSQKRASKLSGAQAGSDDPQGRESLSLCIDRRSNTNTPAEKMELDVSHNSSIHLATANNDMDFIDGDGSSDKTKENVDSAKLGRSRKRRRESPDGLKKKQKQAVYPNVNFSNVRGNESILKDLVECCYFLENPEFLQKANGDLPTCFLLHGPMGCGKSLLATSIAGEYKVPLLSVKASELVGGISGDSEANIRDLFNQAAELAPCVLLIDDVHTIATKREMANKGMESIVVTQLSNSMDDLKSKSLPVLMICATSRPDSLDEAFRRTGRFDIEYELRHPTEDARKSDSEVDYEAVQHKENVDSAESGRPRKRRRESSDGLKKKKQKQAVYPNVNFSNVGGNESILKDLEDYCYFLECPEFLQKANGDLPTCFLLHGPMGCGKSLLATSIAGEYKVPLLSVRALELVGGISGDSEANIRDLFNQAAELAPCVLLIDDVHTIATNREMANKGMESRVVTQLSNSMDDLKSKSLPVLMICATSRPDSLDEAFRRTGRFDIEYELRQPTEDVRERILQTLCQKVHLAEDVSLSAIAKITSGYVGYDLKTLVTNTNSCAQRRAMSEFNMRRQNCVIDCEKTDEGSRRKKYIFTREEINSISVSVTMSDFQKAETKVTPIAKQQGVILVPNTTWDDIGGLHSIRKELNRSIMAQTRKPNQHKGLYMATAVGVLLVGPPGCGKTSIGKAVANEAGINFLYVKGAALLNKYVGESEKNVGDLFKKARSLAPCVIFFDEIDSICPPRSPGSEDGPASRVTNQLLIEMDGLEPRNEVHIIAATNREDCLDEALLRPGRIDKVIYVGLPSPEGRVEILKALTKNGTRPKLTDDVDLDRIGKDGRCDGFSGADLRNLLQVAKEAYFDDHSDDESTEEPALNSTYLESALEHVRASVNAKGKKNKKNYEAVKRRLKKRRAKEDMAGRLMQILLSQKTRKSMRQQKDVRKKRIAKKRRLGVMQIQSQM